MDLELVDFGQAPSDTFARPRTAAPSADAPYEERADWSERYVAWLVAQTPQEGALPQDVHATHRYEVEFNSCVGDPEAYERETRAELARVVN